MASIKEKPKSLTQSQNSNKDNDENSDENKSDSDIELNINTVPLKITFLGNSSVGKTSIISKFCDKKFETNVTSTISAVSKSKKVKIDPFTEVDFQIWDTAGQERFRSITKNYLHNSNGILLVFDLSNEKSFTDIDSWLEIMKDVISENKVEKILVGNKSDLPDLKISNEIATKYANEHNMKYLYVSAKEGINIEYLFEMLGSACVKNLQEQQIVIEVKKDNDSNEKVEEGRLSALSGQFKNEIKEDKIMLDEMKENDKNQKENKTKKCC